MNGKLLWQKDLGDKQMRNEFGEGSTPVALQGPLSRRGLGPPGRVVHRRARQANGKEIWRTKRDEIDSWATPLVVEHEGAPRSSPAA